jgi:hypothetical protein
MKKVWFTVLFFLSLILFAGCQTEDVVPTEPEGDYSVTVEVLSLEGEKLFDQVIRFFSDTEQNFVEILDDAIDLDYTISQFGAFITGVAGIYPPENDVTWNYWFSILIDGELSWTGLDTVEIEDGKTITFQISTMLDETDLWVDQIIYSFIETRLASYINQDQMHFTVVLALNKLKNAGYDVPSVSSLAGTSPTLLRDSISNAYKTATFEVALGLNTDATLTYLETASASNHYEAISQLSALTLLDSTHAKVDQLIAMLISGTPEYMDADYAGMVISALSHYFEVDGVQAFIDTMILEIEEVLTMEGITSWGSANSASTAQAILGLVSLGLNPREVTQTGFEVEFDLIAALQMYEILSGFKYTSSDSNPDLAFSTPQGFAALVVYKLYRDTWGNPPVDLHR